MSMKQPKALPPRRQVRAVEEGSSLLWRSLLLVSALVPTLLWASGARGPGAQQQPSAQAPAQGAPQTQARPSESELTAQFEQLEPRYQQWLRSVRGLITQAELEYFLALNADFRRDMFQQEFWKIRDPDPLTPVNEIERRWQDLTSQATDVSFVDIRALLFLLNGPPGRWSLPDGREVARCFSRNRELEIWFYGGSDIANRRFPVVLFQRTSGSGYEAWRPGAPLRANQRSSLPTTDIRLLCADDLLGYAANEIARVGNYDQLLDQILTPPTPPTEWLATLVARTTDLPEGSETFDAELEVRFPARNQSRTSVEILAKIPRSEAPGRELDGVVFHNFVVNGEILREDRVFETFGYRFEGPTPASSEQIPVGLTRYLRPGVYTLRLLIEDLYSGRFAQIVRDVDVPRPDGLPPIARPEIALTDGRPSIDLLDPPGAVQAGLVRFEVRATGELDRVAFFLDDRQILSKRNPPYSAEIDLGDAPAPHRVRAVGYLGGEEVATDQLWLNQAAQRFRVRMIEPRAGGIYPGGLTVRVEVDTPEGQAPERVELYVNDKKATTVTEPPYARGLVLPGDQVAVVRAVAFLADGSEAEDSVVVNTADFLEEVAVRLVEVPFSVVDSNGQPIPDLRPEEVTVFDGDRRRTLQTFTWTEDLPIYAVLLIDRSSSMEPRLGQVSSAALAFARSVLASDRDRVAVSSFADDTRIDVGFTPSVDRVELAIAGLDAIGGTALYDAIAVTLNAAGEPVSGAQRAIVLFTDGQDEDSSLRFEQVSESAQRTGVPIFSIGLLSAFPDRDARRPLERLAEETGGQARFVDSVGALETAYQEILQSLRSRYLATFQIDEGTPSGFRELRVEVDRRGAEVNARSGYWNR